MSSRQARGFTLVEMLVVLSIVGILASLLFTRVLFYQEMAEKAAMQQVVGAVQSALVIQYGHRMTLAMGPDINKIIKENPLDWLTQKPQNYAGEVSAVNPAAIKPGSWAFDRKSGELIYVPAHSEYFVPDNDGYKWIRFRTSFAYDVNPGSKGKAVKYLAGVTFAPVKPYQWSIRDN